MTELTKSRRPTVRAVLIMSAAVVCAAGCLSVDKSVTLARDGRSVATIVVADPETDERKEQDAPAAAAWKAAETLKRYVARASGSELPIVTASKAPADGTLILVGRSAVSERYGLASPSVSEGARIVTFPRGLAILGEIAPAGTNKRPYAHDRGTLHGVYLFLEKHLGFRFYFEDGMEPDLGVVVPDHPTLTVSPVDETSAPAFPYRLTHCPLQDMLLAGSGTEFRCNHSHFGWDRRYKDKHPEYFSLQADGSRNYKFLCYGNPEVRERELEQIEAGGSTDKYIQVEPDDNWSECQCPLCQARIDPKRGRFGKHAGLWWDYYVRELALAVDKRWPEKRISCLAYQGRVEPGRENMPDNVDVMVCVHNAPIKFLKEPQAREAIHKLLVDWSRMLGGDRERLYVWDYLCYPNFWTCAPILYPHTQQQFLRDYRNMIGGEFLNIGGTTTQAQHYMLALTMRLLWNPDLDVDAYLRDYCQKFFGPGADAMERVYRLLIDRYERVPWPDYNQPSHTAWASPGMLYGRTYTPEVIEQLEQLLCEAQEAVGQLPGGRAAEFSNGEGWFVRRNATAAASPCEIVVEAADQAARSPTLRWDGGEMAYRGDLLRGQRLVVEPGPKAKLLPVSVGAPPELVPLARRLDGELTAFAKGYGVHSANLGVPAFPGALFRIRLTGKAEDGANSLVQINWAGAPPSFALENRLGSEARAVDQVFKAPAGARALSGVTLYRHKQKGTVWYGGLSVRREFAEDAAAVLPPEGKDVTALIKGDAPVIPARTTLLFQLFSDSLAQSGRREAVDLHMGGKAAADAAAPADDLSQVGGAVLRVIVQPRGLSAVDSSSTKPTIYQRRVAWMRDAWESFQPTASMYDVNTGFLVAARVAHGWIGRTPEYRVARIEALPRTDLADPVWARTPAVSLVRGRSCAQVPVDDLGFASGNGPTRVRILHDEKNIYAAFECVQPEQASAQDSVTLTLYRGDKKTSVTCGPGERPPEARTDGATATAAAAPGGWTAFMTIPKSAIDGGMGAALRADLLRARRGGLNYLWSPPLDASWTELPMARRGLLRFD